MINSYRALRNSDVRLTVLCSKGKKFVKELFKIPIGRDTAFLNGNNYSVQIVYSYITAYSFEDEEIIHVTLKVVKIFF